MKAYFNNYKSSTKCKVVVATTYIAASLTFYIINRIHKYYQNKALEAKAKTYIDTRNKNINDFYTKYKDSISQELINTITSKGIVELSDSIKKGKYTSEQVVLAFSINCCLYGKEYNWIADTNFELALSDAKQADERYKNTLNKSTLPRFHGIPISIKDQVNLKGFISTRGYMTNADKPKDLNDGYIIKVLKNKGFIPFVKSNTPQGNFAYDSVNKLYGESKNPWNKTKTTGGSSGGEAGLIAGYCSPVGIGSDIAGSIRVPCNFCGLYGLKPTSNRISKQGNLGIDNDDSKGYEIPNVPGSLGPMTKNMEDLIAITEELIGEYPDDFKTNQCKYNKNLTIDSYLHTNNKSKIKVGYCLDNSICETAPGIKSHISHTLSKLRENEKYEVIEFPLNDYIQPIYKQGYSLLRNSYGIETIVNSLNGEYPSYYYTGYLNVLNTPKLILYPLSLLYRLFGQSRKADFMIQYPKYRNCKTYIQQYNILNHNKANFYKYFKSNNFDCLILPQYPFPALSSGQFDRGQHFIQFLFMFNLLDMPGGAVPLGLLEDTKYGSKYNDYYKKVITESLVTSKGLPVGVQVLTLPNEEELCLRIMKDVDDINRFDVNYSKEVKKKILEEFNIESIKITTNNIKYIKDMPVQKKKVVDLGCGLGLEVNENDDVDVDVDVDKLLGR